MFKIEGELREEEQLIEDKVLFSIEINTSNNFLTWGGSFISRETSKIKVGNIYLIKLEDNRKGKIIIQSMKTTNNGTTEAIFIGSGSLK
jgi:hypothetical protein